MEDNEKNIDNQPNQEDQGGQSNHEKDEQQNVQPEPQEGKEELKDDEVKDELGYKDYLHKVREQVQQNLEKVNLSKINFNKIKLKNIDFSKINIATLKKNYIWIIAGVLILTFLLTRTIGKMRQIFKGKVEEGKVMEIVETIPVKVYKVKLMDFKDTLPVMGRVEGFKTIELRFDGKGKLESFNFEEGERILEGDIIASLDQKDALLKLKYAGLEMSKSKKLYEIGGIDKLAYDQKRLEYESAKRDLEKTNIYAPSDGYLGSKETHTGAFVTSQDKLGTFVEYSNVYAVFDVIEEDSSKIELGQNTEIFLDAYPGASYTGTIDMVSPMIEGRTRTQKIKIELENEDQKLKPGMFARSIINTYEKKDALIVPSSSFKREENKYYVYVVHPEEKEITDEVDETEEDEDAGETGVIEQREIEIEYLTHDMAEIGKGLKEGELIIRELHRQYKDKDKVEITEVQETIF